MTHTIGMATKLVGYDSCEESDSAENSSTERTHNEVFMTAIRFVILK